MGSRANGQPAEAGTRIGGFRAPRRKIPVLFRHRSDDLYSRGKCASRTRNPLGILIGILSGLLALSFLRTIQVVRKDARKVGSMLAQVAGIPTLWFTVPFGSKLLTSAC